MRPIWKGAISFGLVHIPVKLYAATESRDVKFRHLHAACGTPIRYQKRCPTCQAEVAQEDIVRAYEVEPARFVVVRDEDLAALPELSPRVIEITEFVGLPEIDPVFFDRTYFLEPAQGGVRAYALLRRAMLEANRVALARVAIRSREHLAAVRVYQRRVLVMETMYWPDEIRGWQGLEGVEAEPILAEPEVRMAQVLVEHLAAPFDPGRYVDRTREALMRLVRARVEGREVVEAPPPPVAPVADLLEALRQSVRLAETGRGPAGPPPGPS